MEEGKSDIVVLFFTLEIPQNKNGHLKLKHVAK